MARRRYAAPVLAAVLVPVLLGVLSLAGCADESSGGNGGNGGGEEPPPRSPAPKPDARADLAVVVEGSEVRVTWKLTNTGSTPLLVVSRVPVPSGAGTAWRPDVAYVTPEGDGARLSQEVFDWPDTDLTWDVSPRVGVTEVPAGHELEQEVVVPVPLQVRHPFGADPGDGPVGLPEDPATVRFCLGVIAPPYAPALARRDEGGQDSVNHGNVPWDSQYVFCSEPVSLGE